MTSLNLPLRPARNERSAHPRRERLQRTGLRRGAQPTPIDAADAALIAHWPRLARRADASDETIKLEAGEEAIATSGWFDSTWELSQGLEISEVQPSELPLDSWLQFYLAN